MSPRRRRFATASLLSLLFAACSPGDPSSAPFALRLGAPDAVTQLASVVVGTDGEIFVVGSTNGSVAPNVRRGAIDALLARIGPDGSVRWVRQLGDAGIAPGLFVKAWDAALSPDGHLVVAGLVNGRPSIAGQPLVATYSAFVAAFDLAEGSLVWLRLLADASGSSEAMGVDVLDDGTIVVAGYTSTASLAGAASLGAGDVFLAWLAPGGEPLRVRRYGGSGEEYPTAFARVGGSFVFARKEVSASLGQVLALELVAVDAEGTVSATHAFAEPATLEVAALAAHPDGPCAALQHRTYSPEAGLGADYGIACFGPDLAERGSARGGAPGAQALATSIACGEDGACRLAGVVEGSFAGEALAGRSAFAVGFDRALGIEATERFGTMEADDVHFARANAIARWRDGYVLVGDVSGSAFGTASGVIDGFVVAP